jgi:hypothetical protein
MEEGGDHDVEGAARVPVAVDGEVEVDGDHGVADDGTG